MRHLKLLLIGIILLFVSTMLAEKITVFNITPSIILPWVVYISVFLDYRYCLSYTFFVALANDLLNPQLLGFTTVLYVLLSHLTFKFHNSLNKDKVSTVIFAMLLINVIFYAIQWLYFSVSIPDPTHTLGKAGITVVYNTLLSCILILVIYIIDKLKIVAYD